MNDNEMMVLAAKAAGRLGPHGKNDLRRPNEELHFDGETYWFWPAGDSWNPLTDDGDALRLAVKLEMKIEVNRSDTSSHAWAQAIGQSTGESAVDECANAATRRAIVKAAAEVGRRKQHEVK